MNDNMNEALPVNQSDPESSESSMQPVDTHQLQNQVQSLKLELVERDRQIALLKVNAQAQQYQHQSLSQEQTSAHIEALMRDSASAVSQLLTQAYLLEQEKKPIQAKDVLQVARRLIRTLENNGLSIDGLPGLQTTYDLECHMPLSAAESLTPGQPVVIRLAGIRYQGKILLKASVLAVK